MDTRSHTSHELRDRLRELLRQPGRLTSQQRRALRDTLGISQTILSYHLAAIRAETHPEARLYLLKRKLAGLQQRAIRHRVSDSLTLDDLSELLDAAGSCCAACTKQFSLADLCFDHIVPMALGGPNSRTNVRVTCIACNNDKSGFEARRLKSTFTPDDMEAIIRAGDGDFWHGLQRIVRTYTANELQTNGA